MDCGTPTVNLIFRVYCSDLPRVTPEIVVLSDGDFPSTFPVGSRIAFEYISQVEPFSLSAESRKWFT